MESIEKEKNIDQGAQKEIEIVSSAVERIKETGVFDQRYLDNINIVVFPDWQKTKEAPVLISFNAGQIDFSKKDDNYKYRGHETNFSYNNFSFNWGDSPGAF